MTDITITLANGRSLSFPLGEAGPEPPCFLLSVRKCGSTITNHICEALAHANGRHFVNVGHIFFSNNFVAREWWDDTALREILRPGGIYGGFRDMPRGLQKDPMFLSSPKLLMIRDPRDALVSEYFSSAFSHPIPVEADGADAMTRLLQAERALALSETIEATVMRRAPHMANAMQRYAAVVAAPNTVVVKYEDVIFHKHILIDRLAAHFGLTQTPETVAAILAWADVMPEAENPRSFIRQVAPGDHRKKLDGPTIAFLNQALAGPMRLFGYDP